MATDSARAVPNAKHTHEVTGLSTTNFASSVYAATGTIAGAAPDDTADGGTATTVARGDHRHAAPCAAPGNIAPDDAAAEGNSTSFARANHVHSNTCATAAVLTRTDTASEGVATSFARSDHVHSLGVLPYGVVARQVITSNNGPHSADATTDFACNNVPVVAGHLYAVILQGLGELSAVLGICWQLDLLVNGSYVDTVTRLTNQRAAIQRFPIIGMCTWEAPSTLATDDFTIQATERTDGGTLTLIGGSAVTAPPRTMLVVDLGDAP